MSDEKKDEGKVAEEEQQEIVDPNKHKIDKLNDDLAKEIKESDARIEE